MFSENNSESQSDLSNIEFRNIKPVGFGSLDKP